MNKTKDNKTMNKTKSIIQPADGPSDCGNWPLICGVLTVRVSEPEGAAVGRAVMLWASCVDVLSTSQTALVYVQ